MDSNLIGLALIVLISYSTQAMSGFGSTILALTLGVHLYPMGVLLPVLVSLDLLVNLYIVTRHHQHINQSLLYRTVIPAMAIGLLAGLVAFHFIQGAVLEKIFGFLVIMLSGRELYRLFRRQQDQDALSNMVSAAYITAAGFIHGIYASGGPLLIYAVSKLNLPKSVFRSTLGAVWLFFSIILTGFYLFSGKLTEDSMKLILILLPIIVIGILLGEWLHHHIDDYRFKIFVFAVLLIAGLSIIIA
ncbi:MAG: sulfite exporter TauE/SafE family protein [Desulfobacterales bacterium]